MVAQIASVALTLFDIAWLSSVLFLLWRIWRMGVYREQCMQKAVESSTTAMKSVVRAVELLAEAQTGKVSPNE